MLDVHPGVFRYSNHVKTDASKLRDMARHFFAQSGSHPDHKAKYFREAEKGIEWLRQRGVSGTLKKRDYDQSIDDTIYMLAARVTEDGDVTKLKKYRFEDPRSGEVYATHTGETREEAISSFRRQGDDKIFLGDFSSDVRVVEEGTVL